MRLYFTVNEHNELRTGLSSSTNNITWFIHIETQTLDEYFNARLVDIIEAFELVSHV